MSTPTVTLLMDENDQPISGRTTPAHNDLIEEAWPGGAKIRRRYWDPSRFPVTPKPRDLTPNQVIDLMLAALGVAGFAACVRSDLDAMVAWRYKMSVARDISKAQAAGGLTIIVAAGLMTAEQRTTILDSWPTA